MKSFIDFEVFNNELLGSVRITTDEDGQAWFVLMDICKCLNIGTAKNVAERLDPDDVQVLKVDSINFQTKRGGARRLTVVNESGMYNAIFVSRKPEAKAFKHWVTHAVLPAVREHGFYFVGQEDMDRDEVIKLRKKITELAKRNEQLLEDYRAVSELVDNADILSALQQM